MRFNEVNAQHCASFTGESCMKRQALYEGVHDVTGASKQWHRCENGAQAEQQSNDSEGNATDKSCIKWQKLYEHDSTSAGCVSSEQLYEIIGLRHQCERRIQQPAQVMDGS